MIRKNLQALFLLSNILVFAKVGIDTTEPSSTLDVSAKRTSTGGLADLTKRIGSQAPRLTLAELGSLTAVYGADQTGAIIYITNVSTGSSSGQRVNINSVGYYYFDGSLWLKLENTNIYNADGTLTGNRNLDYNDNTLTFGDLDKGQTINFSQGNGIRINKPTSGTRSSLGLTSGSGTLWLFNDENTLAQIKANGTNTGLSIGTTSTSSSSHIAFTTSEGNSAGGLERMRITGTGNVGIATSSPTEKLQVTDGTVRFSSLPLNGSINAINTTTSGALSTTKDQTFNATRTLVADNNGVVGYKNGLPESLHITKVTLPTSNYVLAAGNSTTAKYTGISIEMPPGTYKIDLNLGLTFQTKDTYTLGSNFVRFRLAESVSDVPHSTFSPDAISPRYASQGFAFSQVQGVVTGSLAVKNVSGAPKSYYLHIDNAASNNEFLQVNVNITWNESSIVYYPITGM